jgi:oligosaccharyltransferase complex subunit beta
MMHALLLLLCVAEAVHTLVLVDSSSNTKTSHAQLLRFLDTQLLHTITIRSPQANDINLGKYGEFLYDNIIILAPNTPDYKWNINTQHILEFIESGRNVLAAGATAVSEIIRGLALETKIEFDPDNSAVFDHFHNIDGDDNVIYTSKWDTNSAVLGKEFSKLNTAPIIFPRGKSMVLNDDSDLLIPILNAESTAYSSKQTSNFAADGLETAGNDVLLAGAIQTLANARVTFVGSLDMLSDEYFQKSVGRFGKSGNEAFAKTVLLWTLGGKSMLRVSEVKHFKGHGKLNNSALLNPGSYRVSDDVQYQIKIEEFDGIKKTWVPFIAEDVQLEVVMMDPYVRQYLVHESSGNYHLKFRLPDVFGVYKFEVRYTRLGYSNLLHTQTVSVHPYRHDEYERFIVSAYPYYSGVFAMMAGFFVFSLVFVFSK